MEIIAHRGVCLNSSEENTIKALEAAMEHNADGIEVDIRLTKDDVCVLYHDTKTANSLRVTKSTYSDLLVAHPQLASVLEALEVLKSYNGLINLEVKHLFGEIGYLRGNLCIENLIREINKSEIDSNKIILSSFSLRNIRTMYELAPRISRAYLIPSGVSLKRGLKHAKDTQCDTIHLSVSQMYNKKFESIVEKAHNSNMKVRVYTINHARDALYANEHNVDDIFTDKVDTLRTVINQQS